MVTMRIMRRLGRIGTLLALLAVLALPASIRADEAPLPPSDFRAADSPSDHGGSIDLKWQRSPDDGAGRNLVTAYEISRSTSSEGEYAQVARPLKGVVTYTDKGLTDGTKYYYRIAAVSAGGQSEPASAGPAVSSQQWFNQKRANLLVVACILIAAIVYYIYLGARGRELYIRRIAGLEAVDEAVGRATEMGRPVLFIPGIQDMDNVQTVAGITILGEIAKMTAQYETKLEVPVSRSIVMSTGRETVRQAYLEAGRPDLYSDDMVHYITDEQFGYVAAVDGIMVRERPAACFYLGAFFAESLILAETGSSIGAIQVAGTAMPTQIPFFVAACDYTLIGEELFAASAYLSKDKKMLGSIKGQDAGKAVAMVFIVVGVVLVTIAAVSGNHAIGRVGEWIRNLFALKM
ncbi:MAG TPA: fibronectin type III domain-containing protein [bacterium]|nr:fibronectin type III domain-containing protein [bacterium]